MTDESGESRGSCCNCSCCCCCCVDVEPDQAARFLRGMADVIEEVFVEDE